MAGANGKPKPKKGANGTPKVKGEKRNATGQFVKGHCGGPGRGHSARKELVSSLMDECVTPEKARQIINTWLAFAASGAPWAVKEFLDRTLGKAHESITLKGEFTLAEAVKEIRDELRLVG